jgi:hypothetical protein
MLTANPLIQASASLSLGRWKGCDAGESQKLCSMTLKQNVVASSDYECLIWGLQ